MQIANKQLFAHLLPTATERLRLQTTVVPQWNDGFFACSLGEKHFAPSLSLRAGSRNWSYRLINSQFALCTGMNMAAATATTLPPFHHTPLSPSAQKFANSLVKKRQCSEEIDAWQCCKTYHLPWLTELRQQQQQKLICWCSWWWSWWCFLFSPCLLLFSHRPRHV